MIGPALIILAVAWVLAVATVAIVRRLVPPDLFGLTPAPAQLLVPPQNDEVDLITRIGGVISDGMDRVDAMRQFGADRFLTFMPMPDGTCWSLTAIYYPNEATAKASHQPTPVVTH